MDAIPKEIFDTEEFIALAEGASKCIVKRLDGVTKLKLRTGRYLYTIKLDPSEADDLLNRVRCPKEEQ